MCDDKNDNNKCDGDWKHNDIINSVNNNNNNHYNNNYCHDDMYYEMIIKTFMVYLKIKNSIKNP